jgi:hypothetical protein
MNTPLPKEVVFMGLLSNCSVAFWMTVSPVAFCPTTREAGVTTRAKTSDWIEASAGLVR